MRSGHAMNQGSSSSETEGHTDRSAMRAVSPELQQQPMAAMPAQPPMQPRSNIGTMIGAGVVAALVAGGVMYAMDDRSADTASGPSAAVVAPPAVAAPAPTAAPAAAPQVEMVKVIAAANPPEAKIYLDNRLLPGNPVEISLPTDTENHKMRIMARGYQTENLTVRLTGPVRTTVALKKLEAEPEAKAKGASRR